MDPELERLSAAVGAVLKKQKLVLATAESCTGGWISQVVTATAGSSEWFERGFVTYSNEAKQELLGVSAETLERFGAVSRETALEMAQGVLRHSHAQVAIAVTGIAGPTGGTASKPVGTVCFAWCSALGEPLTIVTTFEGDREQVRRHSVLRALTGLLEMLDPA
jgi:nicotinamide-nucleotide amidase